MIISSACYALRSSFAPFNVVFRGACNLAPGISLCFHVAAALAQPTPPLAPVFTAGADGYSCYRIPSMIATSKGVILAVADGRITNCADIPNPLDLVLK